MRRKTTIVTGSTAILAAALLVPVGGTAEAAHRDRVRDPLVRLALRVEGSARQLDYAADRYSHHATHRERRALRQIERLEDEARDFRVTLQRRGPWAHRTEREYGELLVAFGRAERAVHEAHARRIVRRQLRDVEVRLDDLDRALRRETAWHRDGRRGEIRIGRAWPRSGSTEIAYRGRIGNGDVRIRYVKREDDYDDRFRHRRGSHDDDSSD